MMAVIRGGVALGDVVKLELGVLFSFFSFLRP